MHRAEARYVVPNTDAELLRRYGPLIDRVARKIAARTGQPALADELWSAGALGLLEAARRFDGSRAVRFETFAEHRVRGAMLDELRNLDHLPRRLRTETERASKARVRLAHELGRDPTDEEVANALGIDVVDLAELDQLRQPTLPLLEALPVPSREAGADELVDRHLRAQRLSTAVARLPERLQTLMALYYVEELTFREIAKLLEISEARVCQLHSEALSKLRNDLSGAATDAEPT